MEPILAPSRLGGVALPAVNGHTFMAPPEMRGGGTVAVVKADILTPQAMRKTLRWRNIPEPFAQWTGYVRGCAIYAAIRGPIEGPAEMPVLEPQGFTKNARSATLLQALGATEIPVFIPAARVEEVLALFGENSLTLGDPAVKGTDSFAFDVRELRAGTSPRKIMYTERRVAIREVSDVRPSAGDVYRMYHVQTAGLFWQLQVPEMVKSTCAHLGVAAPADAGPDRALLVRSLLWERWAARNQPFLNWAENCLRPNGAKSSADMMPTTPVRTPLPNWTRRKEAEKAPAA